MTRHIVTLLALSIATSALAQTAPVSRNLLANPGLEGRGEGAAPPRWRAVTVWGTPATFAIDTKEMHAGEQSFRIGSIESTQSFLRSEPIDVAPGETIRASAWAKVKDIVAEREGAGVVLTAEFLNGDGHTEQFATFVKVTEAKGGAWQRIGGIVTVPPLAATVRLRLAFFDCAGTAWFDDASVEADRSLVARLDLPTSQLFPDIGGIPVLLINRDSRDRAVRLRATLGETSADADVALTGATTQPTTVPLAITTRGQLSVAVSVHEAGVDRPLFTETRKITVPPALAIDPPVPTHWVRADGKPQGFVRVHIALTAAERATTSADVELLDAGGVRVWRDGMPLDALASTGGRLPIGPTTVSDGQYRLVVTLRSPGKPPIAAEQRWTVLAQREPVTVGKDGFPRVGGKPIFPLGVFNGSGRMKELGEAGFTIAHAYNSVEGEIGERLDHAKALAYLDAAEDAGMKALMLVPRRPLFAGDMEAIRERVMMFRNHPALLAWDEEEGIARGDMTPQRLAELRKLIREVDPHHPLMVGDSRDVITNVTDRAHFFPADNMDLGMWWWYPIPPLGPKGGALGGDEITAGAELVPPAFLTLSKLKQPLWVGVQSYKKPQSYGRFPTPSEYRAQAYLAIIHGAKGLMWYGGSVEGGIFLHAEEGNWPYLKALVHELREMAPVLASAPEPPPAVEPAGAPLSIALRRVPGARFLLCVNRSDRPVEATFRLPGVRGEARVEGEDRTAAVDGRLVDRFEGYATHVYRLP